MRWQRTRAISSQRLHVHDVCLIASTKRHSVVEMVTPNIWMACWMWRTVVIMATSKRGRGTRVRHWVIYLRTLSWSSVVERMRGFPFVLRESAQPRTHAAWSRAPSLLARNAMLARYSLSSCVRLSVRSVTSRYCIKTTGRIELVFGMEASFHLFHTVL